MPRHLPLQKKNRLFQTSIAGCNWWNQAAVVNEIDYHVFIYTYIVGRH